MILLFKKKNQDTLLKIFQETSAQAGVSLHLNDNHVCLLVSLENKGKK